MIDKNVKTVTSAGEECFVCEREIRSSEKAIRVSFNINLILTTTEVSKEMHIICAVELRSILDRRIKEATGGRGGKTNGR